MHLYRKEKRRTSDRYKPFVPAMKQEQTLWIENNFVRIKNEFTDENINQTHNISNFCYYYFFLKKEEMPGSLKNPS